MPTAVAASFADSIIESAPERKIAFVFDIDSSKSLAKSTAFAPRPTAATVTPAVIFANDAATFLAALADDLENLSRDLVAFLVALRKPEASPPINIDIDAFLPATVRRLYCVVQYFF